jgi:hypothetical protein
MRSGSCPPPPARVACMAWLARQLYNAVQVGRQHIPSPPQGSPQVWPWVLQDRTHTSGRPACATRYSPSRGMDIVFVWATSHSRGSHVCCSHASCDQDGWEHSVTFILERMAQPSLVNLCLKLCAASSSTTRPIVPSGHGTYVTRPCRAERGLEYG